MLWKLTLNNRDAQPAGRIRPPNMLYPALATDLKVEETFLNDRDFVKKIKLH